MEPLLIVIVLCLIGVLLLLAEIFLIPGTSIAALLGVAASICGVYFAFSWLGVTAGFIALFVMLLIIGFAVFYLVKSKAMDKIGLQTDINSTITTGEELKVVVGDEGITLSRLNPIGKVQIKDTIMEGKSMVDFIDEHTPIVVIQVSPNQLTVKKIEN